MSAPVSGGLKVPATSGRHPVAGEAGAQSPNGSFGSTITPPGPQARFFANNHGKYNPQARKPFKLFPPPLGMPSINVLPAQSSVDRDRFTGPVTPDASLTKNGGTSPKNAAANAGYVAGNHNP